MRTNYRAEMYYTYAYLREDATPYYVGKGKGSRAFKKGRNEIKPPKNKRRILILKQNLTEEEAFRHEIYMIDVFGRKDLGTGILHNRTNGGDGSSGVIVNEASRRKNSESKIGEKNFMYGKIHTEETKLKMSNNHWIVNGGIHPLLNKSHTEETKHKISKSMGKKCYVDGVIYESVKECATILGIHKDTVSWRMRSKSFPNYYYL